jgi:hypothetical protein
MQEFNRIINLPSERTTHYNQIITQTQALDQIIKLCLIQ